MQIGELARLIISVVGRDLSLIPKPATAGSPTRRAPDMSKMEGLTGYSPRVDLEEGVRRTYDWYAANVFAGEGVSAR